MRALLCSALALSTVLTMPSALAQTPEELEARLDAVIAAAEAQAVRPGDEALRCDQLLAEMNANEQNPEYLAHTAAMNETVQDLQQQARAARPGAALRIVGGIALGVAATQVPGLGYLQMLMQGGGDDEQQHPEEVATMMQSIEATMPYTMRNQRLYQLAQAQQCAFAQPPAEAPEQVAPEE